MLVNGMFHDYYGGVCINNSRSYYTYTKENIDGVYYNVTGYTSENYSTGEYILIYKNINPSFNIDVYDDSLCLFIETGNTIHNWVSDYINSIATTGYTNSKNETSENRILYEEETNEFYKTVYTGSTLYCLTNNEPIYAIVNKLDFSLWDGIGDYFYYESDFCGKNTGREIVVLKDINKFSDTYDNIIYIERVKIDKYLIDVNTNVSGITTSGATIIGSFNQIGVGEIVEKGYCYSIYSNPTIEDFKINMGVGTSTFYSVLNTLFDNTEYYFRAYAINSNDNAITYGNEISFKTKNASKIYLNLSIVEKESYFPGNDGVVQVLCENAVSPYDIYINNVLRKENYDNQMYIATGLTSDNYLFKVIDNNLNEESGYIYMPSKTGITFSYTTTPTSRYDLTDGTITLFDITNGNSPLDRYDYDGFSGVPYGSFTGTTKIFTAPSGNHNITLREQNLSGNYFTREVKVLSPPMTLINIAPYCTPNILGADIPNDQLNIHVQYCIGGDYDHNGAKHYNNIAVPPELPLNVMKIIGGGSMLKEPYGKGICWSYENNNPTINDNVVFCNLSGDNYDIIDVTLTGLTHLTYKYIRSFAINVNELISYSDTAIVLPLTDESLPVIGLSGPSNKTETSLTFGYDIFNYGNGTSLIEAGFCYSDTSINPTTGDSKISYFGVDINSNDAQPITISGLTSGTTYYFKSYAINNNFKLGYSDVLTGKTNGNTIVTPPGGYLVEWENYPYNSVYYDDFNNQIYVYSKVVNANYNDITNCGVEFYDLISLTGDTASGYTLNTSNPANLQTDLIFGSNGKIDITHTYRLRPFAVIGGNTIYSTYYYDRDFTQPDPDQTTILNYYTI